LTGFSVTIKILLRSFLLAEHRGSSGEGYSSFLDVRPATSAMFGSWAYVSNLKKTKLRRRNGVHMPTKQTSDIVLSFFQDNDEYGAFELLDLLKAKGVNEPEVKEALSYLISDHQLELTPNRRLRALQTHA
jgi:hypothetical protein